MTAAVVLPVAPALPAAELLALFVHFLSLSLFATGGVMALASDIHRYVVDEHSYINHSQFVGSIALGQAAPGPNLMWVVVMGWLISGLPGALATTLGLALPALVLPLLVSRASRLPQFDRGLQALQRGLGPVALGLMAATCYLLVREAPGGWKGMLMIAASLLLLAFTRLPPLLLIVAAGTAGAFVPW
jgi:chromate transporter